MHQFDVVAHRKGGALSQGDALEEVRAGNEVLGARLGLGDGGPIGRSSDAPSITGVTPLLAMRLASSTYFSSGQRRLDSASDPRGSSST